MAMAMSSGPIPGIDLSPGDVYLQPTPAGPVPMVFPALGMRPTTIPTQTCFFYIAFPFHTMMSMVPACIAGPGPGIVSGMVCSSSKSGKGSTRVLIQGQPMARALMDMPLENGLSVNSVGISSPSQATFINPTG
jgi:uncharacterized protein DUF4150